MGMDISAYLVYGVFVDFNADDLPPLLKKMAEDEDGPGELFDGIFGWDSKYLLYKVGDYEDVRYILGVEETIQRYDWAEDPVRIDTINVTPRVIAEFRAWLKEHKIDMEPAYYLTALYSY